MEIDSVFSLLSTDTEHVYSPAWDIETFLNDSTKYTLSFLPVFCPVNTGFHPLKRNQFYQRI